MHHLRLQISEIENLEWYHFQELKNRLKDHLKEQKKNYQEKQRESEKTNPVKMPKLKNPFTGGFPKLPRL